MAFLFALVIAELLQYFDESELPPNFIERYFPMLSQETFSYMNSGIQSNEWIDSCGGSSSAGRSRPAG